MSKIPILFTKKLSEKELADLDSKHIKPVIQPFIKIESRGFSKEIDDHVRQSSTDGYIFTSKHAVKNFITHYLSSANKKARVFAVGARTAELLRNYGFDVKIPDESNGTALAKLILEDKTVKSALFFCGTKRRDEVIHILAEHNIKISEIHLYETHLIKVKVDLDKIQGVAFFSPSGVEGFCINHSIMDIDLACFAIGNTSAKALIDKGVSNVIVSEYQNVRSVSKAISNYFA